MIRVDKVTHIRIIILCSLFFTGCTSGKSIENHGGYPMQPYLIGRFSLSIPTELNLKLRSSMLRETSVSEIIWNNSKSTDLSRTKEWEDNLVKISEIEPPNGKTKVIIRTVEQYPKLNKWAKGIFYYCDNFNDRSGQWSLLLDSGPVGVWIVGEPTVVESENIKPKMAMNIENIANHYKPIYPNSLQEPPLGDLFYLQQGLIELPYLYQEESIARFEGHPLQLTLLIEMYMDASKKIEDVSLISGTRAMLAASLFIPGSSMSKVRLRHRDVAGMPGEESVLRIREGDTKNFVFTWRFNGKDNSGEYPTTRIEMESPDGNLDEKLQIWDAILDSMKPMFVRKAS